MRLEPRRISLAVALLAIVICSSGCIVWCGWPWCEHANPRMAVLHVYVSDYYTGYAIPWATVELYETDWWDDDFLGSRQVDGGGYAQLYGGYLYPDGRGGDEERDFLVRVYASGYCWESYEIELDYYYPSETLHFYLVPCFMRGEGGDEEAIEVPIDERPPDRIRVGEEARPDQPE